MNIAHAKFKTQKTDVFESFFIKIMPSIVIL